MNDKNVHDIDPGEDAAVDLVAFGIKLDDIVFPDGRTSMGMLGGGGLQTGFGMRLWSPSVGLAADIPCITDRDFIIDWLRENQIDPGGIRASDLPTPRAWQVMEEDGRRTQVMRVPEDVISAQFDRTLDKLPLNYQRARGFHFGVPPDTFHQSSDLEFIQCLRRQGAVVSIECFQPAERAEAIHPLAPGWRWLRNLCATGYGPCGAVKTVGNRGGRSERRSVREGRRGKGARERGTGALIGPGALVLPVQAGDTGRMVACG